MKRLCHHLRKGEQSQGKDENTENARNVLRASRKASAKSKPRKKTERYIIADPPTSEKRPPNDPDDDKPIARLRRK